MGIGFALSPAGADHMHPMRAPMFASEEAPSFAAAQNMGILDAVDTLELNPAKARM